MFEDHYIDVPEEKVDVVDSLADRVEELEGKLNEELEYNINLSTQVKLYEQEYALGELSGELTDIEAEKLRSLSEGVAFEDVDQYKKDLGMIKENYFPRTSHGNSVMIDEEFDVSEDGFLETDRVQDSVMSAYVDVIGRR